MVTMEPATVNLLNKQFNAEQLQNMFPKNPTKEQQQVTANIIDLIDEKIKKNTGTTHQDEKKSKDCDDIGKLLKKLERMKKNYQTKGLRIDLVITDPNTGTEWWIDVTAIHPTCKSRLQGEYKRTIKNNAQLEKRLTDPRAPRGKPLVGKAVEDHNPLLMLGKKQTIDCKRASAPTFFAVVCSTLGEFGRDTFKIIELLTASYKRKLMRAGPRNDDCKFEHLSARYRNNLRNAIQVSVARGFASMLMYSGLPSSSCRKYVAEEAGHTF